MMKLYEIPFTDYYHQFLVIEADDLTEACRDIVDITEDDCYALCSSYCAQDGLLMFNVLAVGPSPDRCTKGLERPEMLAYFSADDVYEAEAEVIEADFSMIEKNHPFMQRMDADVDEDLQKSRWDARFDALRDLFYPDMVLAGIIVDEVLMEYDMIITGTEGPFLAGSLAEEPETDIGIHIGDRILALPYVGSDEVRLFAMFAGDRLSQDEETLRKQIMDRTNELGIGFYGVSLKS